MRFWNVLIENVQSISLLENFTKINSWYSFWLVFISECLEDYHRRLLNTNLVLK